MVFTIHSLGRRGNVKKGKVKERKKEKVKERKKQSYEVKSHRHAGDKN